MEQFLNKHLKQTIGNCDFKNVPSVIKFKFFILALMNGIGQLSLCNVYKHRLHVIITILVGFRNIHVLRNPKRHLYVVDCEHVCIRPVIRCASSNVCIKNITQLLCRPADYKLNVEHDYRNLTSLSILNIFRLQFSERLYF